MSHDWALNRLSDFTVAPDKKLPYGINDSSQAMQSSIDESIIEDADQGDLDMSGITNKIWLVKVPKFLADHWSSVDDDPRFLHDTPHNQTIACNMEHGSRLVRSIYVCYKSQS